MKIHNASFRVGLASLIILSNFASQAFNRISKVDGSSTVPIDVVTRVELERSGFTTIQDALGKLPVVLSQTQRDDLRNMQIFRGKSDLEVDAQYNGVRILTLNSVRTLHAEDPFLSANLLGLYQNNRINLAPGGPSGILAEVRHDGSSRVADESINFYHVPKPEDGYELYEPGGFNWMNQLAYQGNMCSQTGYEGRPLQDAADGANFGLAQYNAAYSASSLEYQRIHTAIEVMDGVSMNLAIPDGLEGAAVRVGRILLNEEAFSDLEKQNTAGYLGGYLSTRLPAIQGQLDNFDFRRTATSLFLDNKFPTAETHSDVFKLGLRWDFESELSLSSEFRYTTITGGGATIDQADVNNPLIIGNNTFSQYGVRDDGTTATDSITVLGVDFLPGALRWDDKLMVAGYSMADTTTRVYGYTDTDNDGFVESNTQSLLFETQMFHKGLGLYYNEGREEIYGFDRGNRNLYQLHMPNLAGFPTGFSHRGGLGDGYKDVTHLGFSKDGEWAAGYLGTKFALQPHSLSLEARYDSDISEFFPIRIGYRYEEVELNPAIAEIPQDGESAIRVTYTPNTEIFAWKHLVGVESLLGSAKTDPYGRAILKLDEPFLAHVEYQFTSEDKSEASPSYVVPKLSDGPMFLNPKLRKAEDLKYTLLYRADSDLTVNGRSTLNDPYHTSANYMGTPNLRALDDKIDVSGLDSTFIQAEVVEKPPVAKADFFGLPPIGLFTFYPAWNDFFVYGALFSANRAQDANNPYMNTPGMASLTSAMVMFANGFAPIDYEYKMEQTGIANQVNRLVILPEIVKSIWPPVYENAQGEEVVQILCLVIGGEKYPIYQFFMRPPDNCLFLHWHAPLFSKVFHLNDDTTGIPDPFPFICGYGAFTELPLVFEEVQFLDWLAFTGAHGIVF